MAPQDAYGSCSGAVRHRQSGRIAYRPKAVCAHERAAIRSPGLPFNGLHPRKPCNYLNHYTHLPTLKNGRLSWPGWLNHSGHLTHEVVTCQP